MKGATKEDIVADINEIADDLGHYPSTTEYNEKGTHSTSTVYRFFETWEDAITALGFEYDETRGPGSTIKDGIRYKCPRCNSIFIDSPDTETPVCTSCGHHTKKWKAVVGYEGEIESVQKLAKGPQSSEEFAIPDGRARDLIRTIRFPNTSSQSIYPDPKPVVYYLPGDERQAISLFIEKNEDNIRKSLESETSSVLHQSWPQEMYELLYEQYCWLGYDDE